MPAKTRMVEIVNLTEILSNDDKGTFDDIVTNDWTYGDTDIVLVQIDSFRDRVQTHLESYHNKDFLESSQEEIKEADVLASVLESLAGLSSEVYVNIA